MKLYSANKVAQHLDISVITLNNWYGWYLHTNKLPDGMPPLPLYIQDKPRGKRFWTEQDLKELEVFKEWLPRGKNGIMGDYNARFWGDRGLRALANKQKKIKEATRRGK